MNTILSPRQSTARTFSPPCDNTRNRLKPGKFNRLIVLFLLALFALAPQMAKANDGHGISLDSYGYDADRGFYVQFGILYYNDDNYDEGIEWATFSWQNPAGSYINVFAIDSWDQGGDSCYDFKICS